MVRRSTWILIIILVILVGFAWVFPRYRANKAENTATASPTAALPNLYNLTGTQVNKITISDSSGNRIGFYRDAGSTQWAIEDVPADQVDSFQIESVSAQLFALQAQMSLTETPPLDSVGLVTPAYTITMTTLNGGQLITYVGSKTPIGSGYYVQVNSGKVMIVDKLVMDDILNLLTNPPLLPTPTPEVTPTETTTPTENGTLGTPTP